MTNDILEQINGEEVIYNPFWDVEIEEKHARDTWDKEDHPDLKCKAFSSPMKILKYDKSLQYPASEYKEKQEKHPQPKNMCNILQDLVDIDELSRWTLDTSVPGVTVSELLFISPDMIQQ